MQQQLQGAKDAVREGGDDSERCCSLLMLMPCAMALAALRP